MLTGILKLCRIKNKADIGYKRIKIFLQANFILFSGEYLMERFKRVYQQGIIDVIEIWVDTETGVNYLFRKSGNAGGFTPLLDKDGKPVVTLQ